METNEIDYNELARDARKEINNEFDRLNEKAERLKEYQLLLDGLEALMAANEKQREEIESLQQQLADEKRQREELDMKNKELNKLSTDVAKKSSEEGLIKALRTYVNNSKRKRPDKRALAKEAALDMVLANKLTLPEDLAAAIECLDDDQADPKVVNVTGNYNDIHDNGTVNQI
jgi:myosin heavy subunit